MSNKIDKFFDSELPRMMEDQYRSGGIDIMESVILTIKAQNHADNAVKKYSFNEFVEIMESMVKSWKTVNSSKKTDVAVRGDLH
tara:strand:+ start:251 stop:502 length:252 start_codon:yes stop_codon:yes gene_type:complete